MIKAITAGVAIAAGLTGLALAVPAQAGTPVNWTARTCAAFATWDHNPTAGNLAALGRTSTRAPWKYLGGDVWQLYGDVRADGMSGKYVRKDRQFVRIDCSGQ